MPSNPNDSTITFDASGSSGMDFDAFIGGSFLAGLTGGGFPVFDNSGAFSGEEMYLNYGSAADSAYVLAHGDLAYFFGTHTVHGTINTIEYGTRGAGSFDANGYFVGGDAELRITGLDLNNLSSPEAEVEATGEVHNFTTGHMNGSSYDPARLDLFAEHLDQYAQHFIGSDGTDIYVGTVFDDVIEGRGGNDTIDGGAGQDTVVFDGVFGAGGTYGFTGGAGGQPLVITDSRASGGTGVDTLSGVELLKFNNLTYNFVTHQANYTPTDLALDDAEIGTDAEIGDVVGSLMVTDQDTSDTHTYELLDDAGGLFALDGAAVKVVGVLTEGDYTIRVRTTDGAGNVFEKDFTVSAVEPSGEEPAGRITIDASGSAGMDFDAFIGGSFLASLTGGGFPVFDNSAAFSGEEMYLNFGSTAESKYILAHGDLEYFFGTHTVHGTINTIEYGTRGTGSFDANGYFVGGDAELKITGLDFFNAASPEAEVEATGEVHNFAVGHMYGASADPDRLALYANHLDQYAQDFIGSVGNDTFVASRFDDTMAARGGDDALSGGQGEDTAVYSGVKADYAWVDNGDGTWTVTDNRAGANDGVDTLAGIEKLQFADGTVTIADVEPENEPPANIVLDNSDVDENTAVGTVVGLLSATDAEGDAIAFTLSGASAGLFKIVGNQLRVKRVLDYEVATTHGLTVTATDSAGGASQESFTIEVNDVNERPHTVTLSKARIAENGPVGAVVGAFSATDPDGKPLTYKLTDTAGGLFKLDGNKLVVAKAIDYEKVQADRVTVEVEDIGGQTATRVFRITVTDVLETIDGTAKADVLKGGIGADEVIGKDGNDALYGRAGNDRLYGDSGNDVLNGGAGAGRLNGGSGTDTAAYAGASKGVAANLAKALINTGDADGDSYSSIENLIGSNHADKLFGNGATNTLRGSDGNDLLRGEAGEDRLHGGVGADDTHGGAGADVFLFKSIEDSTVASSGRDTIFDFRGRAGDRIDLSAIDANARTSGNQAFDFIGSQGFSGDAGELRYVGKASDTFVYGDVDGDRQADFAIHLDDPANVQRDFFFL